MKNLFKIITLLIFLASSLIAQSDTALVIAEKMPEFPGGVNSMMGFINKNVQYPAEARERGEQGKAFVKFIVDTSGKILHPIIIKSTGSSSLDNEAIRVVKSMPDWVSGVELEKKVNVYMTLPFSFKIGNGKDIPNQIKLSPEEQEKHDKAMAYYYEGHKLEGQYKYDKALEKYNKSLTIESENKYAMFDKGKMLMVLGDKISACETWNKMIEINLRKDEAEEFVKKYCEDENGPAEMVKYLNQKKGADFFDDSMKDIRNGRYEAALHKLDSSLKYRPEHKDALFNKAMMQYKLDQKTAACVSWKKLLEITPEDKEVEELIRKNCN